jgi:hypothetical protein
VKITKSKFSKHFSLNNPSKTSTLTSLFNSLKLNLHAKALEFTPTSFYFIKKFEPLSLSVQI